jgi:hypothetical protein
MRVHLLAALIAAVLMAATWPSAAKSHAGCHDRRCSERVAAKQCSQARPVPCIRRAALRWRVDFATLLRKARCESTLDPLAVNGVHAGLFQFRIVAPSTWATTPYAQRSPWRAKWSSLAAGFMHHVGRGDEWSCR